MLPCQNRRQTSLFLSKSASPVFFSSTSAFSGLICWYCVKVHPEESLESAAKDNGDMRTPSSSANLERAEEVGSSSSIGTAPPHSSRGHERGDSSESVYRYEIHKSTFVWMRFFGSLCAVGALFSRCCPPQLFLELLLVDFPFSLMRRCSWT